VIPRQSVAQAIRLRHNRLAHRYLWQHLVDQMNGAFGHPALEGGAMSTI
jgi:hypothetical protein